MNVDTTLKFMNHWGDAPSIERLKTSHKSLDVQKVEAENYLKGMALRFERAPNQATIKLWASDMIDAGYQDSMVKEVCKSAPYKFEKHPTLSQLMELLTSYKPKLDATRDELNDLQDRCFAHLRKRFITLAGEDSFNKMVDFYASHEKELLRFNRHYLELCVLGDWLRSYLKDGTAIMAQRVKTLEACATNNREYFTRFYRKYAEENKL